MAFDAHGSRIRALERQLMPTGICVVVEGPSTSQEERRENTARLAETHRAGRDGVLVRIDLSRAPAPRPPAAGQGAQEVLPGRNG